MKLKRMISALIASAVAVSGACLTQNVTFAEENSMTIVIDGEKAVTAENGLYRGLGMVSGNNSSRLLLDYKAETPERYWEIMNHTFGGDGLGITHLKIEMGSDINSSSGTEPAIMRSEDETPDVTRGAGFQLAADAKTINPDLTLDMLWWSEPIWVTNSEDVYAARYKWYKANLDTAYDTYGLVFDYVSANRNERTIDAEWTKYLSKSLKAETDCPYDYSKILIVGGDGSGSWGVGKMMLKDDELLNAIDVIGGHYSDWTDDEVKQLHRENGKEVWFSEGCPTMVYSTGTYKYDASGSGLNDINGVLDIANRIITMYPGGDMTLYEFQPVIAAYYDGVTYCHKQLITANSPWSGYYKLDNGFFMSLHFSQFFKKGWTFIDGANYADGKAGGDGHAIVDAVYSYMTASDKETGDYSTVITNTTANDITYSFEVSNLAKASSNVSVWETRGPDSGSYNENYFKKINTIAPTENGGKYTYSVTIKPYSMITVSTIDLAEKEYNSLTAQDNTVLSLPYTDDFEYADYPADYLSSRGGAPRYTTDEGGAFEVINLDGNNVLKQFITPETQAEEWGATPEPVTNFGDDLWFNYSASVDVLFNPSTAPAENYTGVGVRYNLADAGKSGYWIQLYEDGTWKLKRNARIRLEGKLDSFDSSKWTTLKIEALGNTAKAYVNGELIADYDGTSIDIETEEKVIDSLKNAGRAALYSSYNQNYFDNIKIEAIGDENYVTRFDQLDDCVAYNGDWTHETISGFKNYFRTASSGEVGSTVEINFNGTGFNAVGVVNEGCTISVDIDGTTVESNYAVPKNEFRSVSYFKHGLENGAHTAKITVLEGTYALDAVEVLGAEVNFKAEKTEEAAESTENGNTSDTAPTDSEGNSGESDTDSNTSGSDAEAPKNDSVVPIVIGAVSAAAVIGGVAVAIAKSKKKK